MTAPGPVGRERLEAWLDRPVRPFEQALGWMFSISVFIGVVAFLGGPIEGDASESVYSTWAVQHGAFACAYAPIAHLHIPFFVTPFAFVAPLYRSSPGRSRPSSGSVI